MKRNNKVIQWYKDLSEGTKIFWAVTIIFSLTLPKYFSDRKYSKRCKKIFGVVRLDNIYHRLKDDGLNSDFLGKFNGRVVSDKRIHLEVRFSDFYGGIPDQDGYYIISYCWDRYFLNAIHTDLKLNDVDDSWLDSTWNSMEEVEKSCKGKIKMKKVDVIRTK